MSRGVKWSPLTVLLIALLVLVLFSSDVVAFGAGNIPSYGYLEGKAFRVTPPPPLSPTLVMYLLCVVDGVW